jgi:hypothetical protein
MNHSMLSGTMLKRAGFLAMIALASACATTRAPATVASSAPPAVMASDDGESYTVRSFFFKDRGLQY